jgi:hypothetical protein
MGTIPAAPFRVKQRSGAGKWNKGLDKCNLAEYIESSLKTTFGYKF